MSFLRVFLAAALAAGACAMPVLAQDETAAALCDQLAASPYDPAVGLDNGVGFFDMDAYAAIDACRDAAKADPSNMTLRFQLARAYDAAGYYENAIRHYEIAIEGGSGVAAAGLGQLYEFGLGVDTDESKAAELYKQGADAGIVSGYESLGKLYEDGRGVEQDYARAAELYAQASDGGSYWGMAALGWLTENGFGVTQDLEEAARLYGIAADAGIDFAQNNLATFYAEGLGGIAQDNRKAVDLYSKAADQGLVLSYINLSIHYTDGLGVKKSAARAEEYLRKAIAEGDAAQVGRASNNLAWLFATENRNLEEAEQLARAGIEAAPDDANRLDTLAWVLHLDGRSGEALPVIEDAAEMDPANEEITAHLAEIKAAVE